MAADRRYRPIAVTTRMLFFNPLFALGYGMLEFALNSRFFLCGYCGNFISVKDTGEIPYVCEKCGVEINWVSILTKIMKECPKCKKQYFSNSNYCTSHRPAVPLREIEVRM
jgi:hypothetical protein